MQNPFSKKLLFASSLLLGLFLWGVPATLQAQDPGQPDTIWADTSAGTIDSCKGGNVRIEIWIKTDNTGVGNDIAGISVPLLLTSTNPAAAPVLDTTVAATFAQSAVDLARWDTSGQLVHNAQSDPAVFPLQTVVGAFTPHTGLTSGVHLFATLVITLSDTTTLCVDTTSFGGGPTQLDFSTSFGVDYVPYWNPSPFCFRVGTYPCGNPPISYWAHSPVNLVVIDPNNDSIGIDFNTIASAVYDVAKDSITIYSTYPGDYRIKALLDTLDQSGETTYTIEARIDGTADVILVSDAPLPDLDQPAEIEVTNDTANVGCLAKPGDANASGNLTLSDIIASVNYIFNKAGWGNCPSQSSLCWLSGMLCRGDWNGSATVNLSDVIRGVNYIFNKPEGPWAPVNSGACCLSVP